MTLLLSGQLSGEISCHSLGLCMNVEGTVQQFGYEFLFKHHVHQYLLIVYSVEDGIFQQIDATRHIARNVQFWL